MAKSQNPSCVKWAPRGLNLLDPSRVIKCYKNKGFDESDVTKIGICEICPYKNKGFKNMTLQK